MRRWLTGRRGLRIAAPLAALLGVIVLNGQAIQAMRTVARGTEFETATGGVGRWLARTPFGSADDEATVVATPSLRTVRAQSDVEGATIVLIGDGRLGPATVRQLADPPRVVLDFPGVFPSAPAVTAVGHGPIERVRVAANSRSPLVTRVVVDLTRRTKFRVSTVGDREVRVLFELPPEANAAPAVAAAVTTTPAPIVEAPAPPPAAPIAPVPPEPPPAITLVEERPLDPALDPIAGTPLIVPVAAAFDTPPTGDLDRLTASTRRPSPIDIAKTNIAAASEPTMAQPAAVPAPLLAINSAPPAASVEPSAPAVAAAMPPASGAVAAPASAAPVPAVAASVAPPPPTAPVTATPVVREPVREVVAPPAAIPMQIQSTQPERRYTGQPISLDFQNIDLRAVLRTFAEVSNLNMVIDPSVKGTVDVSLRDVPWDQALEIILRANGLGYVQEGTIIRIAALKSLADEEKARADLAKEQAAAGVLVTITRVLSYAKAKDVADLLKRTAEQPSRARIEFDERSNLLIVTDLPERVQKSETLIAVVDRPQPQVEIEARIIQTSRSFSRELGIQLGIAGEVSPALGNTLPTAFPNSGSAVGVAGHPSPTTGADAARLVLKSVNGSFLLDARLSALERDGKVRILSAPKVVTLNNVPAEIKQGSQIPYTTAAAVSSGGGGVVISGFQTPTVSFKDVALKLVVTPQITAANTVILDVEVSNDAVDFSKTLPGSTNPAIATQSAKTKVLLNDGSTTVIGGVILNDERENNDRTPALHKIPLLGWLFKRNDKASSEVELLVFITPKIVKL